MNFELSDNLLEEWLAHCQQHFPSLLQERALDSHKGSFGTVGLIGGAEGMTGALVLAGAAALKNGCGKVWLGFAQAQSPVAYVTDRPELMLTTATQLLQRDDITHWAIGCGMGTSDEAYTVLDEALSTSHDKPLVLDADALNLVSAHPELIEHLHERLFPAVLTPHPKEAARLLDWNTYEVQAAREEAALELADKYQSRIVLKGHQSIIAAPDEAPIINNSGNPGLATAGSGDVLTGMIISLLAQGLPADEAVAAAVWLHGAAADLLVLSQIGPIGLCSAELSEAARFLRNVLIAA